MSKTSVIRKNDRVIHQYLGHTDGDPHCVDSMDMGYEAARKLNARASGVPYDEMTYNPNLLVGAMRPDECLDILAECFAQRFETHKDGWEQAIDALAYQLRFALKEDGLERAFTLDEARRMVRQAIRDAAHDDHQPEQLPLNSMDTGCPACGATHTVKGTPILKMAAHVARCADAVFMKAHGAAII